MDIVITHLLRKKRHYLRDDGIQTLRNFRLEKKCQYYRHISHMLGKCML